MIDPLRWERRHCRWLIRWLPKWYLDWKLRRNDPWGVVVHGNTFAVRWWANRKHR